MTQWYVLSLNTHDISSADKHLDYAYIFIIIIGMLWS